MKQKLLNSIRLRLLMLLAVLVSGINAAWGQTDKSAVYTSNVTLSTTGGTSASTAKVSISSKEYDAIKAGAKGTAGVMKITVPSGTKYLHLHIAAWSGETCRVGLSPNANLSSSYIDLTSDTGVSGSSSTYTLNAPAKATTDYYKVLTFTTTLTKDTEITFTAGQSSTKNRFVIWGVNSEEESVAPAYTITAQSNNNTFGTVSLDGSVITGSPAVGYRYASPAYTVITGSASVVQVGNNFTVTPESDCTVQINFEAIPTYTVTYGDGGSVAETSGGAGVTLATRSAIGDYEFAGWSETNVNSETTQAPTIIGTNETYYPTANITLYPVYTRTESGAVAPSPFSVGDTGDFAIVSAIQNGKYYALPTAPTVSSGKITAQEITVSETDGVKYISTEDAEGFTWTIATATNGYTLSDGKKYIFHSNGGASGTNVAYDTSTTYTWAFTADGDFVTMAGMNGSTTNNRGMLFSGTTIGGYALSNASSSGYYKTMILPIVSNSTTYYWSSPSVVNVTGVTLDQTSKALNVGDEFDLTATVAPNEATNKAVNWTSSNDALATVVDGHVTALAAGTPTITVTTVDGSFTATCNLTITNVAVTGVTVAPASTSVKIGKTVSLTPTVAPDNATNKNVTWESSNTSIATVDNGVVTGVATGEATITVKSAADPTKSASCTVTVIAAGDGTKANPYDVDEALEIISGYDTGDESATNVYIKGIISTVNSYSSNTITYYISADGTTTNQMQVYKGKGLNNADFSGKENLKEGDVVVVYGKLKDYYSTPEINSGNYLYSLNGVKIPEITFGQASYEVLYNGSLTITATADCSGVITFASSDATIAEINATTGVVTPHKSGSVTITANVAASVDNIAGSKGVELTVTDGRASAGIEFADATITKTWGEDFTGQDLTNPNKLAISYSSSAPTVATVNASTGAVEILKAGTTVITATFDGDGDYMAAEESYTLTVNKAAAGLSFSETAFDIDLNDDSFVAPTLNNPNSLTVTYTSSNESIAVVDENTGELLLDTSAEGTASITASFTENDWFNAGSASYSITITDPDRKGTKKNPYTVAEVIDGTATGSGIYVKGYIVGEYVGKTTDPRTSGFTTNGNIAIADAFTASPTAGGSIPVQLGTDALKNAWGCQATSGNLLGYEVIVKANKDTYFSVNGLKNTSEISATSIAVTVGAAGYTTITTEYAVSFDGADVTAYKATAVNPSTIHLEAIDEAPADEALVIKAAAGRHTGITIIPSAAEINDNLLLSSNGSVTGNGTSIYALGVGKSGVNEGVVGFYLVNDKQTIPAGKAYLNTAGGGAVKEFLTFVFDDLPTTVSEVKNDGVNSEKSIFNLAGQKMSKMQKGVNIVNGKKVLVK